MSEKNARYIRSEVVSYGKLPYQRYGKIKHKVFKKVAGKRVLFLKFQTVLTDKCSKYYIQRKKKDATNN